MTEETLALPDTGEQGVHPGLYFIVRKTQPGKRVFTAISAPIEAVHPAPHTYWLVDVPSTLRCGRWLRTDGDEEFGQLPRTGVAVLMNRLQGWNHPYDVFSRVSVWGYYMRVSSLPEIEPPFPILWMHTDAFVTYENAAGYSERVTSYYYRSQSIEVGRIMGRPWWEAGVEGDPLGTEGASAFTAHPQFRLWQLEAGLATGDRLRTEKDYGVVKSAGVFGMSWVSDYAHVLESEDDTLSPRCKRAVQQIHRYRHEATGIWY